MGGGERDGSLGAPTNEERQFLKALEEVAFIALRAGIVTD